MTFLLARDEFIDYLSIDSGLVEDLAIEIVLKCSRHGEDQQHRTMETLIRPRLKA